VITDAVLRGFATAMTGLLALFPHVTFPSWFTGLPSQASSLGGAISGFGAWVPFSAIVTVMPFVLTVFAITVTGRLIVGALRLFRVLP
jgi:hypothetical protein